MDEFIQALQSILKSEDYTLAFRVDVKLNAIVVRLTHNQKPYYTEKMWLIYQLTYGASQLIPFQLMELSYALEQHIERESSQPKLETKGEDNANLD